MRSSAQITLLLGLAALQPLVAAPGNSDSIQGLLNHSPFGSPTANPALETPVKQPIEFRAVMEERGNKVFSIYETCTRQSTWVSMRNPTGLFRIEAYDDAQQSISVLYQGRSLTLPLTSTSRRVQKVTEMPEPRTEEKQAEAFHDAPFRIGHVAEELEIRAAVRVEN